MARHPITVVPVTTAEERELLTRLWLSASIESGLRRLHPMAGDVETTPSETVTGKDLPRVQKRRPADESDARTALWLGPADTLAVESPGTRVDAAGPAALGVDVAALRQELSEALTSLQAARAQAGRLDLEAAPGLGAQLASATQRVLAAVALLPE